MNFTPDPNLTNTFVAPFEKEAFLGAIGNALRGAIPFLRNRAVNLGSSAVREGIPAAAGFASKMNPGMRRAVDTAKIFGAKYGPSSVAQRFEPYGKQVERGAVNLAGKMFGNQAKPVAHRMIRGVPREMVREGLGGAAIGGLLEGGIGAATAEEGEGLSAFGKGFGSGALSGGAMGALTGGIGKGIRNARSEATRRMALQQGVSAKNLNQTLKDQRNQGVFSNMKALATGKGNALGRAGAGLGLAGGAAQFGGEWMLPGMIMPSGETEPPPPPAPQAFQPPQQLQQQQQPQPKLGSFRLNPIDFTKLPRYHHC